MKPEVLMEAMKMWPVVQRRRKVYKSEWADSNRLSISYSVLFSGTPNFGSAKAHPAPPLTTIH
jgi:hypothetical protein